MRPYLYHRFMQNQFQAVKKKRKVIINKRTKKEKRRKPMMAPKVET